MSASSETTGRRCSVGIDFGTESGRVLVLDLDSGEELAVAIVPYRSAVIDRELPVTGERLPHDWALQDPDDWREVILRGVPEAVGKAGIAPSAIVGIGIDFTSCTVLPVGSDGEPLCCSERWRANRNAWPKLWKHHAAQPVADRLNEVALERGEPWLARYGGRISSEWYYPKLIELWLDDRDVYDAADAYVEATDWIVWWLSGARLRNASTAGFKALWSPDEGFPSVDYFTAAYPGFDAPTEKLGTEFVPIGTRAGTLRPSVAKRLGLPESVAVAVGNVDAWVTVPALGVDEAGAYVMVVGTSICDMVVHPKEIRLPGITGVVRDGVLPGLYGYEAGQVAVGDMLAWFVGTVAGDAEDPFTAYEGAAARIAPGATGLVALDWWNGNRAILADADLSGAILGLGLHSSPSEIYRALLESIAFGNRRIIDNFEENGMALHRIVACGGIAEKSPLTMQLVADTTGLKVSVAASSEIPARGSALFGGLAAGAFTDLGAAVAALKPEIARTYTPDDAAKRTYDRVYAIYRELYEVLGRSRSEWLHGLKRIRTEQHAG